MVQEDLVVVKQVVMVQYLEELVVEQQDTQVTVVLIQVLLMVAVVLEVQDNQLLAVEMMDHQVEKD